jgi:hypothetical protein
MNRFAVLLAIFLFGFTMAWAQAPASQPAAAAPAASSSSTISGCMTQSFGIFTVPESGKTWNVKGNGASLWNMDNHVVKVTGIVDPKATSPVIYAQSVQDTGQPCGNAAAANAAAPNGTNGATAATAATGTTTAPVTGATAAPANGAPAATTPSTTSPTATTAPATTEPQQPGGAVAQNPPSTATTGAQASGNQAGTTGVTTPTPQSSENKGTTAAGSPQGAITSDNNTSAAPAETNSTYNGCLTGSVNNYQFKSNGKTFHLQGNTTQLNSMINHNVEITGEDFNEKAIQVNGARDLGTSCK